ncbi:unnamed protein product [Mytilus coruscus]|uniref:Reverse transcriptase domain-containing protein n=1 Tax=Mytilus coruscus TaxID=42192 RepID=A0A6J8AFS7_MYTCO|nr:unnamed protein product [Mytilus coruscus]
MGRDWLHKLQLNWNSIFKIEQLSQNQETKKDKELQDLLRKYPRVFKEGLGTLKGTKARMYVDKDATPKYFKARPVPYALKEKIERELDSLEKGGNIEKVEFSEWAAPIVPMIKPDKSVRICGDYKVTINQVSKLDNYPIPKTDDLYATLSGGQAFSKLDLSQAYQQIVLDEESRKYLTINTHKGLYQYNRLPFGGSSATGIFQRTIENLLQGIPRVVVRVDDILVTESSKSEHLDNLETVLSKLQESGMRLIKDKCVFLAPEVVYLGHIIDQHGIYPVESKVKAITEATEPKNVTELKSYLGMLNYYNRFLQDLSSKLAPLHELLQNQKEWKWDKPQQEAFELSKTLLKSSKVLVHYDPNKEIILSCDASPYGIGAVLSHRMEDGCDRPVGYISRTLAPAERNYSVLEKEGLAIIFALKKFHQYLFDRKFTIYTDYKPLIGLFNENKSIPPMAAARLQRWALTLSARGTDTQDTIITSISTTPTAYYAVCNKKKTSTVSDKSSAESDPDDSIPLINVTKNKQRLQKQARKAILRKRKNIKSLSTGSNLKNKKQRTKDDPDDNIPLINVTKNKKILQKQYLKTISQKLKNNAVKRLSTGSNSLRSRQLQKKGHWNDEKSHINFHSKITLVIQREKREDRTILNNLLLSNNLKRVPIAADGNCFLKVLHGLQEGNSYLTVEKMRKDLVEHLQHERAHYNNFLSFDEQLLEEEKKKRYDDYLHDLSHNGH